MIEATFVGNYAVSELHRIESHLLPRLQSDEKAIRSYYKKKSGGRLLNLDNPKRFSEKLQWYKLHHRDPLMQQCANKITVRDYVESAGYGHLLNDLLAIYDSPSEINLVDLPDQFVLKAAHGSAMNIIVKDKNTINWRQSNRMMESWLRQDIYWSGREWVYKDMPRNIIAERYLQDETGELRDYKFFCFNGVPQFMQLEIGRGTDSNTRNFYDMDWNLMPFGKELPHNPLLHVKKPELFDEMKAIASDLCKPFQFVRVDLYQASGRVYFGELTFFPAGGAPDFVPDEYDEIVGNMWKLVE